jgi:hypothetical protein
MKREKSAGFYCGSWESRYQYFWCCIFYVVAHEMKCFTTVRNSASGICHSKRRINMKVLLVVAAALLSALALSACEKQPVAAPAPVIVTVPGPAGPQGPAGAPAEKGAPGAQGAKGEQGEGTIVVVPAPAPQR